MNGLWNALIVLKDRCHMAVCGNSSSNPNACRPATGLDEDGNWTSEPTPPLKASADATPSMDTNGPVRVPDPAQETARQ